MSDKDWASVTEVFPLLVPSDPDFAAFEGFITLATYKQTPGLWLRVSNPAVPQSGPLKLEVDDALRQLLRGHEARLQLQLNRTEDLNSYLLDLRNLLEVTAASLSEQRPLPLDFYQELNQELESVGWEHLLSIDHEHSTIELDLTDTAGRHHNVRVQLCGGSLDLPALTSGDLPKPLALQWGSGKRLQSIVQQYQQAFDQWQDFWDCMDDLDQHTWVVDPQNPKRSDCSRRVALGQHCFLQLQVDPSHPRSPPDCSFLGAPSVVEPLRDRFYASLTKWDPVCPLRENLENMLGMQLPTPEEAAAADDMSAECAICYAYYLPDPEQPAQPGAAPSINCPNAPCSRGFHHKCLAQWLGAMDGTMRVLNTLFGKCPYCDSAISVNAVQ